MLGGQQPQQSAIQKWTLVRPDTLQDLLAHQKGPHHHHHHHHYHHQPTAAMVLNKKKKKRTRPPLPPPGLVDDHVPSLDNSDGAMPWWAWDVGPTASKPQPAVPQAQGGLENTTKEDDYYRTSVVTSTHSVAWAAAGSLYCAHRGIGGRRPPQVGTVPGPLPTVSAASLGPDQGGGQCRVAPTPPEGGGATSHRRMDVENHGGWLWGLGQGWEWGSPVHHQTVLDLNSAGREGAGAPAGMGLVGLGKPGGGHTAQDCAKEALALLRQLTDGSYISCRPDILELIVDGIEHKSTNLVDLLDMLCNNAMQNCWCMPHRACCSSLPSWLLCSGARMAAVNWWGTGVAGPWFTALTLTTAIMRRRMFVKSQSHQMMKRQREKKSYRKRKPLRLRAMSPRRWQRMIVTRRRIMPRCPTATSRIRTHFLTGRRTPES